MFLFSCPWLSPPPAPPAPQVAEWLLEDKEANMLVAELWLRLRLAAAPLLC